MADSPGLKERVQDALDEARTLVLGTQVLLGFQYQAVFEPGFKKLGGQQPVSLLALIFLLANFAVLILPITTNLLADHGQNTAREYQLTTRCVAIALPLFAPAIAIDIDLSLTPTTGAFVGWGVGLTAAALSLGMWFGIRRPGRKEKQLSDNSIEAVPLKDKVRQVLTESRVVLPGAQALLGFAAITTMLDSFPSLPVEGKVAHICSLVAVVVAIILLMTPAAIHRLAEHGDATERFHKLAGMLVMASLLALAVSLSGEVFVVFLKVTSSDLAAGLIGSLCFLALVGTWFLLPLLLRPQRTTPT